MIEIGASDETGIEMEIEPVLPELSGVGGLLKASRLRCGAELREVSQALRIRQPYLEAIEDGRFEDLPGRAYVAGFVRCYAEYLGLDAERVVNRLRDEAGPMRRADLAIRTPQARLRFPGGAVTLIALALAVLAYGGWYVSSSHGAAVIGPVQGLAGGPAATTESPPGSEPAGELAKVGNGE